MLRGSPNPGAILNVSKETSRSEQVADVKGPFLRFLYLLVNFTVQRLVRALRRRHVMSCGALASRCKAFNLSSQDHLPTNA